MCKRILNDSDVMVEILVRGVILVKLPYVKEKCQIKIYWTNEITCNIYKIHAISALCYAKE